MLLSGSENNDAIDQFISDNRNILNTQKIVRQHFDAGDRGLEKLLPILKKHNIFKYRMETSQGKRGKGKIYCNPGYACYAPMPLPVRVLGPSLFILNR